MSSAISSIIKFGFGKNCTRTNTYSLLCFSCSRINRQNTETKSYRSIKSKLGTSLAIFITHRKSVFNNLQLNIFLYFLLISLFLFFYNLDAAVKLSFPLSPCTKDNALMTWVMHFNRLETCHCLVSMLQGPQNWNRSGGQAQSASVFGL